MRFMIMHKNDPRTEAGQPPPMELVTRMGAFVGEYAKAGRFVDGAGLSGSKTRTRLVFRRPRSVAAIETERLGQARIVERASRPRPFEGRRDELHRPFAHDRAVPVRSQSKSTSGPSR